MCAPGVAGGQVASLATPQKAWNYYVFQALGLEDKDPGKPGEVKKHVKGGGEASKSMRAV